MKNIIGTITCAFAIAAALLSGGCKSDKEVAPDVSSEQTEIRVNKRGLDYNGGEVKIDVKSNTYWIINYDEENVDWIEVTPRASHGDTEVTVAVDPNMRDERAVTLYFDTVDGVKLEVSIYQSAYGETISYYNETFGDGASAAVADYNGWSRSGFGSDMVRYSGSAQIAASAPSAGYEGASGGNAALFAEDGDTFTLGPIDTKNDVYFRMSFGVSNTLGAFDKEGLKVEASMDGDDWYPFAYETGVVASGWGKASAIFHIIGVDRMYLRFTGKAGYAIDDLLLLEGSESDNGYELEFSLDGDDNYKPGYVFFEDNFDWLDETWAMAGKEAAWAAGFSDQECKGITTANYSAEKVAEWTSRGYGYATSKCRVYIHFGNLKIGRSVNANKNVGDHAGYFILPTNAVADITDGASIAVKFEMDVCTVTSLNDTRNLTVSCSNGESYDFSFEASALKEWTAIEPLVFHNVSNNCTFTVSTMKQQSAIVPNRVGLDNIRISKYDTSADK